MSGKHMGGRVEQLLHQLEKSLLDGSFPANARLPSERLLAEQYGVSRNTVREAMQRLAARGLVRSRPGAGVFVTDQLRTGITSAWGQLVTDHPAMREDILEFRRVLEGATAYFAALRCDEQDRARIREQLSALEDARNAGDHAAEASADARLHEAIARASHNTMFLHLHSSVLSLLREHISLNRTGLQDANGTVSEQLLIQHRCLCEAICERRPEEARTAMQAHIDFVRSHVAQQAD